MKRFRLTLTVFTLLSLCLLVSAKDAAEWGRAKKAFKKAKKAVGTAAKKTVSFVKTTAKKTTNAVKHKVITRPTFYGECERKKKNLFGTCGKDTECVPKESGCKGACACDKTGVNECKCRGLYGGGMKDDAITLFGGKYAELGKSLGGFVAGMAKGNNDVAEQFETEQCYSEVFKLQNEIMLDMKVIDYYFRKTLAIAEDRPSEEVAFQKSFEGEALLKLQRKYLRLLVVISNFLQKGLVVASKCGVEEKSVKLLGVTSAALVMKESFMTKNKKNEVLKDEIAETTRSILVYLETSAEELRKDLTKETFFKVLGNVARHLVAGKRDTAVGSKRMLKKFGLSRKEPRTSLDKDVEALVSSEGSMPAFESSPALFKVRKTKYRGIPAFLRVAFFTKTAVRGTVKVGKKIAKGTAKVAKTVAKGAKKVGEKIAEGAEEIGKKVKSGVKKLKEQSEKRAEKRAIRHKEQKKKRKERSERLQRKRKENWRKFKKGAKTFGGKLKRGVKMVGRKLKKGAKAVAKGTVKVGKKVAKGTVKVGEKIVEVGKEILKKALEKVLNAMKKVRKGQKLVWKKFIAMRIVVRLFFKRALGPKAKYQPGTKNNPFNYSVSFKGGDVQRVRDRDNDATGATGNNNDGLDNSNDATDAIDNNDDATGATDNSNDATDTVDNNNDVTDATGATDSSNGATDNGNDAEDNSNEEKDLKEYVEEALGKIHDRLDKIEKKVDSSDRPSYSRALLETSSDGISGECNEVSGSAVLDGLFDGECKDSYEFNYKSNDKLIDCMVFVGAWRGKKNGTFTSGRKSLKLYWNKDTDTVSYDLKCTPNGRRRLLQVGGQGGSC